MLTKLLRRAHRNGNGGEDALAALVMAAREDHTFRRRLILVLRLPLSQRQPLLHTAIEEMRLRGEPVAARLAFATVASEEGARTALKLLECRRPAAV